MFKKSNLALSSVLPACVLLLFVSCYDDPVSPKEVPVLITADVSEITATTAQCGGTIKSGGGATVTARGVCWSTNRIPTVHDSTTTNGTGPGSFASSITNLITGTPYYVRAYATNSVGTGYGSAMSFTTAMTDIDGNVYQTVTIGNQVWMAENLKVTHYRNGDSIPNVTDSAAWLGLTAGAHCSYDNDSAYVAVYGRLYNWYAVADSRTIAPTGWRVPSDIEWQVLVDYLGGDSIAGGKMKETTHWASPIGATNESGFSALPGGYRDFEGFNGSLLVSIGYDASFWSSTEVIGSDFASYYRHLGYDHSRIDTYMDNKRSGFSVRCVKD